ncbi:degenerate transposase (Orf1) [Streptococcus pneumoniae]|nr:degenerate transposase (Orf1) [Streptococcus pneumoniae]
MSCFVAFHYRSYGTFFLHKNKLHNIYSGFTHYKYYRAKKSNFWGVFIMKLSYDDKVQIYELRKQGYSLEKLSNKFGINNSNLRYMIKLIDRYGIEFVKKGKNRYYSPDLKQEMIHKV